MFCRSLFVLFLGRHTMLILITPLVSSNSSCVYIAEEFSAESFCDISNIIVVSGTYWLLSCGQQLVTESYSSCFYQYYHQILIIVWYYGFHFLPKYLERLLINLLLHHHIYFDWYALIYTLHTWCEVFFIYYVYYVTISGGTNVFLERVFVWDQLVY